ncbi:MAG TPA: DUF4864 domain-containing protein [Burkholderiaceae bacterium]|nr:DUF4864 domain-containing protein [Burkholderiaceae bacterium]
MRLGAFVCSLLMLGALPPALAADDAARADAIAEAERRAVRGVIESQLKAFADGRAAAAFAHATPAIRAQFHDAATFMTMVRGSYPMLIKPAAVSFFQPEWRDGTLVQGVQLRDRDGRLWRAVYQLERDAGGRGWRIGGCAVAPDRESATS